MYESVGNGVRGDGDCAADGDTLIVGLVELRRMADHIGAVCGALEPDDIPVADVAAAHAACVQSANLVQGARMRMARRIDEARVWADFGERSAADYLARTQGMTRGGAQTELAASKRIADLPATDDAVRAGRLSPAQAATVADGAAADPSAEGELLSAARKQPVSELRAKSRRVKAAADPDPEATQARLHRQRYARRWTDSEGAYNLVLRGTGVDGARIDAVLAPVINDIFNAARRADSHEHFDAYVYDAVFALLTDDTIDVDDLEVHVECPRPANGASQSPAADAPADPTEAGADEPADGGAVEPADAASAPADAPPPAGSEASDGQVQGDGSVEPTADQAETDAGADVEPADAPMFACSDTGASGGDRERDGQGPAGNGAAVEDTAAGGAQGAPPHAPPDGARGAPPGAAPPSARPADGAPPGRGRAPTKVRTRKRIPRGRETKIIVRIDAAALRRGYTQEGETCEVAGVGQVSVSALRRLLPDAFFTVVIRDGVDVATVAHIGRRANAYQQTAMEDRPYLCEVPDCDKRHALEEDHIDPYENTKRTLLKELAWLCKHHHAMKTNQGWRLTGPLGNRRWIPPVAG